MNRFGSTSTRTLCIISSLRRQLFGGINGQIEVVGLLGWFECVEDDLLDLNVPQRLTFETPIRSFNSSACTSPLHRLNTPNTEAVLIRGLGGREAKLRDFCQHRQTLDKLLPLTKD